MSQWTWTGVEWYRIEQLALTAKACWVQFKGPGPWQGSMSKRREAAAAARTLRDTANRIEKQAGAQRVEVTAPTPEQWRANGCSTLSRRAFVAKKLTPWFPIAVDPSRDGVYEVRTAHSRLNLYSLYRNGAWHGTTGVLGNADAFGRKFGRTQVYLADWRGLAEQPK